MKIHPREVLLTDNSLWRVEVKTHVEIKSGQGWFYVKVLIVHLHYCFKMSLFKLVCDIWCMTPLHQLLDNFLFVYAHLICFGLLCLISCLLGGGHILWYRLCLILHVKLIVYAGKEVLTVWISFFSIFLIIVKDDHVTSRS